MHLIHVTSGDTSDARVRQVAGQLRAYVDAKAASIGGWADQRRRSRETRRPCARNGPARRRGRYRPHRDRHPEARESKELDLGTTEEKLLQHSPCPVVVAGPKPTEPHVHYPAIAPACADCLKARATSHGSQWWCAPPRFVRPPWRFSVSSWTTEPIISSSACLSRPIPLLARPRPET